MIALAYAAIYLVWGSTYLAISFAVQSIPPLLMMGLRCVAAGLLLLMWSVARGERAAGRHWAHAALAGALMFAGCYGALAWAEQRVASGFAALLSAMTPFWFTAFEWTSGSRPTIRTAAGLFIGLVGVVLLVSGGAGAPLHAGPVAAILGGTVAWTLGSLYARPPRLPRSLALSAGMPLLAGGLLLLVASWTTHELARFRVGEVSAKSAIALAYLVVFGSLVAFTAYAWLLRVAPPSRVATHAYVNPLVAVALGAALAGEPITATAAVAGLVIAGGVAMTLAGGRIHV